MRYAVVGVIGTVLHIGSLIGLVEWFNVDVVVSSVIGFIFALLVSYVLNRVWVFKSNRKHGPAMTRYVLVSLTGLSLNVGIMYLIADILHWWYGWGVGIVVIVVPITNFILNYSWSFSSENKTF